MTKHTIRRIWRGVIASIVVVGLMVLVIGYVINRQASSNELRKVDALLVLGAAQWDGKPSPVLEARLNEAVRLYRLGYARRIIVSGGTAPNDSRSEASVSNDYLIEQKIDPSVIVMVSTGNDTRSTLLEVKAEAQKQGIGSFLIVTDPPHMLRALKMAHDFEMISYGAPVRANAPNGNTANLKALWRESWAYLAYVLLDE